MLWNRTPPCEGDDFRPGDFLKRRELAKGSLLKKMVYNDSAYQLSRLSDDLLGSKERLSSSFIHFLLQNQLLRGQVFVN